VHSIVSGAQNVDALYFMLEWDWYGFHKKHTRIRYAELMFLHLVGLVGHIVHFSASGVRIINAVLFMHGYDRCGLNKKGIGPDTLRRTCIFLHPVGSAAHVVHSGASGVGNVDTLFFLLRWDQYGFDKMRGETHHPKLVVLLPVGSAGHVVHSGPSGA
jgi:hypothetical protein